ncbi:hypothetical protein D1007_01469 [Hordeum vulgare]|nr:hypothetical protein D1007_01469 [Hordeum vulgare]
MGPSPPPLSASPANGRPCESPGDGPILASSEDDPSAPTGNFGATLSMGPCASDPEARPTPAAATTPCMASGDHALASSCMPMQLPAPPARSTASSLDVFMGAMQAEIVRVLPTPA